MKNVLEFTTPPIITAFAGVAGKKEGQGPLQNGFDVILDDDTLGFNNWEKAESEMMKSCIKTLLQKSGKSEQHIDYLLSGDLLNQCSGSAFSMRDFNIKYLGLFGACSTMAEGIAVASVLSSTYAGCCIASTSSHFCSAEKQFRFPLEYGGQRAQTSQWTVTGSGSVVIEKTGTGVKVKRALMGKIIDLDVKNVNNMGAAMAPAACDTVSLFLKETGESPDNYDLIVTGDLAFEGEKLFKKLMQTEGYSMGSNYTDSGLMIYDRNEEDVHAGGSGCGCSALVLTSHILPKMMNKELKRVLFIGTGALMSQTTALQGESIPGIAHLIELEI